MPFLCLCIYVCGLFDYKKKEMQAKLNRLHTKNKEREKKKRTDEWRKTVPVVNDAKEIIIIYKHNIKNER
jgi:hypothetical protein